MRTNLLSEDISGHGITLYFRWLIFAMVLAILLFSVAYITYYVSIFKQVKDAKQTFDPSCTYVSDADRLPNQDAVQHNAFTTFSLCMFCTMACAYVVVLIAGAIFQHRQRDLSFRYDENTATHEDYAVLVDGLPEDATEPPEIIDFFQGWLERIGQISGECHRVVGVSIAYDYKEHADLINQAVCQWVEELEWSPNHHLITHHR
jgi:hypothetical protein